ncbi:MAG: helix-turn-helix domain-containing protein [Polyangiaceae bacterium]
MTKQETLAERIQRLREAKGWSQAQLAEEADMAPAAVSRLVTGERPPRMEHLLALARALGVTLTELTIGTDAAGALRDWISRDDYERSERNLADAENELALVKAENESRLAEIKSLQKDVATLTVGAERAAQELAASQAQAARAERLAEEKAELERTIRTVTAERDRIEVARAQHEVAAAKAIAQCNMNYQAVLHLKQQVTALSVDLKNAKDGQVATGLFSAALGAIVTGAIVSSAGSSSGRKRSY